MVDIRPQDLNPAVTPIDADSPIIIDQGLAGVNRTTSNEMVNAVAPVATQAESEVGTDDVKRMTALKTKQSIASEVGVSVASYAAGEAGLSAVQSVNGKSGNSVTLVKGDVGLGNVDNTSDVDKPISTAVQTALNGKATTAQGALADTALQAPGGTTGQVLAKNSATDNDVAWISSEAATAVSYGPQTLTPEQQEQAKKNIAADIVFDSKVALEAAEVSANTPAVRLNGYDALGDGNGGLYVDVNNSSTDTVVSDDGRTWYRVKDVGFSRLGNDIAASADVLFTVGGGGDFSTINDALKAASRLVNREYKLDGFTIEVRLLSGFVMSEQVIVKGTDLSWITVTSEDPVVTINRSSLVVGIVIPSISENWGGFCAVDGALPKIGCLFNMDSSGADIRRHGILAVNSRCIVLPDCGVTGAGGDGALICQGSTLQAQSAIFNNAGRNGINIHQSSTATAESIKVNNAAVNGMYINQNSSVHARYAEAQDAGQYGAFFRHASRGTIDGGKYNRAGLAGVYARHSCVVDVGSSEMNDCGSEGVFADWNSVVDADLCFINDCGATVAAAGARALRSSTLNLDRSEIKNASLHGVLAEQGSTVDAPSAIITGSTQAGILSTQGSSVSAHGANLSNSGGTSAWASYGGEIDVSLSNLSGAGINACHSQHGGTITAHGANCSGATQVGLYAGQSGVIRAGDADCTNAGTYGAQVASGGEISGSNIQLTTGKETNIPFNSPAANGARIWGNRAP